MYTRCLELGKLCGRFTVEVDDNAGHIPERPAAMVFRDKEDTMERSEAKGPRLLRIQELAQVLGVHERTCRRLTAEAEAGQGDFPRPVRISRRVVRWRREDVERYLAGLGDGERG
jgi:predicted DNA-binding transcriptional regulator AlpA